jgi:hypothetical protein
MKAPRHFARHLALIFGLCSLFAGHRAEAQAAPATLSSQPISVETSDGNLVCGSEAFLQVPGTRNLFVGRGGGIGSLEHTSDQRRRQAVIAKATLACHRQQPRRNKPAEMLACGRARYVGAVGQLGCRQRLSAHQGRKHCRSRGIPYERGDFDQICDLGHSVIVQAPHRQQQAKTVRDRPNRQVVTIRIFAATMRASRGSCI